MTYLEISAAFVLWLAVVVLILSLFGLNRDDA